MVGRAPFVDDPVLDATGQSNDARLFLVGRQELVGLDAVFLCQLLERLGLLLAHFLLQFLQHRNHFLVRYARILAGRRIANCSDQGFNIELGAAALDVFTDIPANCVAELSFV